MLSVRAGASRANDAKPVMEENDTLCDLKEVAKSELPTEIESLKDRNMKRENNKNIEVVKIVKEEERKDR